MMNVTRLGMLLAVSVCAIPIWAMSYAEDVTLEKAAWKAAWLRGIQQLPPAATPFPDVEAILQSASVKMPAEGVESAESFSEPLFAETPFVGLGKSSAQRLLSEC